MILGEVIGTVVADHKTAGLEKPVFLLVREVDPANGTHRGEALVVYDPLGARQGEIVMVAQGSSVRQTEETKDRPLDAIIMGIVDLVDQNGGYTYKKTRGGFAALTEAET